MLMTRGLRRRGRQRVGRRAGVDHHAHAASCRRRECFRAQIAFHMHHASIIAFVSICSSLFSNAVGLGGAGPAEKVRQQMVCTDNIEILSKIREKKTCEI